MNYDHPVPFDRTFTPRLVPDLLTEAAARHPSSPMLDFFGRRFTYAEILDQAQRAAAGFRAIGIGAGNTVGLFLPNCPHYVIAFFGALMAGARVVNFSPLYTVEELVVQVEDSETDVMVTLDAKALFPTIDRVLRTTRLQKLIVGNIAEALPSGKGLLYRLFQRRERSSVTWDDSHLSFADLIAHEPLAAPARPDVHEVALLQYTGGTTGRPKGAMLTHANLSINAAQVNAIDDEPDAEDRILAALPLFHIFALTAILNRTIMHGGMMVLLPKFEVKSVLAAIQRVGITAFPGVPTMYRALLDYPDLDRYRLDSLRICISGGAPMPEPLKQEFVARTGAKLVEGYGLTESSGVVCVNPYRTGGKPGSIGQPLPGTEIRLLDRDDPTKDAPVGESGELAFRGPQRMAGYWKRDDGGITPEGYMRTGDVATVDEDGYYYIIDRLKDMVIVGGFKVFPSQVEIVLYMHEAVREAIVIGVPDDYLGERPKAFVTLHADADISGDELRDWANARIGKHERLVAVEIRAELPKTMVGKLSRKELVAEEREKAARVG